MILPAALFYIVAFLVPLGRVVELSFMKTDFVTSSFVGLRNYRDAFEDSAFLKTFFTAGLYVLMVVPVSVFISYRLSVSLAELPRRTRTSAQAALYLPTLTAGIIISFVWRWVFGRGGIIALGMDALGFEPIAWFANAGTARGVIAFAVIFSAIGGNCVWLVSVLLGVPRELVDQARVDGAGSREVRRYVIFPWMRNTLLLLGLLQAIGALQYWEVIYSLTSGGPFRSTETPIYDIYQTAFTYGKHGLAAAKSLMLLVTVAVFLAAKRVLEKRRA